MCRICTPAKSTMRNVKKHVKKTNPWVEGADIGVFYLLTRAAFVVHFAHICAPAIEGFARIHRIHKFDVVEEFLHGRIRLQLTFELALPHDAHLTT